MELRHDAPIDAVDLDALGVEPNADELKRLFEFLEFRTLGDRLTEALTAVGGTIDRVDLGGDGDREELVAEVDVREDADAAAALLSSAPALDVAAAWEGEPGRSPLSGLAVVADGPSATVAWLPPPVLASAGGARRRSPSIEMSAVTTSRR